MRFHNNSPFHTPLGNVKYSTILALKFDHLGWPSHTGTRDVPTFPEIKPAVCTGRYRYGILPSGPRSKSHLVYLRNLY